MESILTNTSLQLPEAYELIIGTKTDYYKLVQVSVIGNVHSMKLIVNVQLKTANSQFTSYKVFALPTRVLNTSFVK